jgi:hypothetical protein
MIKEKKRTTCHLVVFTDQMKKIFSTDQTLFDLHVKASLADLTDVI